MGTVNQVMLVGYLGRDADLRYTQGGTAVANFSCATTEKWTDKGSGEEKEKTEWTRVSYFGKGAEGVSRYLTKGKLVCVQGRLETREWKDKDGKERVSTEVRADRVTLLSSGGPRPGRGEAHDESGDQRRPEIDEPVMAAITDDDIPF